MAKRKYNKGVPRNKSIDIDVTEEEKARIVEKARKAEMFIREYIREAALNSEINVVPKVNTEFLVELRRIGVNINQIAHVVNTNKQLTNFDEELKKLEDWKRVLKTLIDKHKRGGANDH